MSEYFLVKGMRDACINQVMCSHGEKEGPPRGWLDLESRGDREPPNMLPMREYGVLPYCTAYCVIDGVAGSVRPIGHMSFLNRNAKRVLP